MTLRAIVPTLGVLALMSSAANAQEIAKSVFLDGWADNILTYQNDPNGSAAPGTLANESNDAINFSANAKLKVAWKPSDKITGVIGVRFNNNQNSSAGAQTGQAYLQESYVSVDVGNDLIWTMGKYISFPGWISAEPTGLYRVNTSTIGYFNFYCNDVIGTNLAWAPQDLPFSGSVHVNNGFFAGQDQYNDTSVAGPVDHRREDLGVGADLIYNLPDDSGFVNLEFAWDPASSTTVGGARPSDIFQVGLNAQVKPTEKLTVAGEVIHRSSGNATFDSSGSPDSRSDLLWLLMGNYTLDTATPMSVTAMFQQVNQEFESDTASIPVVNEISLALLTNPFGSDKLGVNFEVAHAMIEGDPSVSPNETTTLSLEALIVIP
jgi:hypothetical protein